MKKWTRRDFLKSSSIAGGLKLGPYLWTGETAYSRNQDKNSRPALALIGCGGKGADLWRVTSPFGDFVACCDVDLSHTENFARDGAGQGRVAIYTDYRKLLERRDLDAVFSATPDHWHTKINIDSLKAGKHVYSEKPLTLTIDEGKVLKKVVEETGRVVQVGAQQRSAPWFRQAVAIARSGKLGNPVTATVYLGAGRSGGPFISSPPPKDLDWDFWLGQAPTVPYIPERCHKTFRWWLEYSGGVMTDWGAHHIDIAQWGIGAENSGPVEISGEGVFDKRQNCFNTAQTFGCTLVFKNGGRILVQNHEEGKENGIRFEGKNGGIFVNRGMLTGNLIDEIPSVREVFSADVADLYSGPLGIADEKIGTPGEFDRGLWEKVKTSHVLNFFNCIDSDSQPISDVSSSHRTASSCHLCNIAMLVGKKLQWDPDQEDFLGNLKASSLLRRQQRKGYEIRS